MLFFNVLLFPDFGYGNLTAAQVPRGPSIRSQSINEVVIDSQVPLLLECLAEGNPQPSYRWFVSNPQTGNEYDVRFNEVIKIRKM